MCLLTNAQSFRPIYNLWFYLYWTSNIGIVFHIGTFYQANLVVQKISLSRENIHVENVFYMIVNSVLPLYRNQPIDLQWTYNVSTGLKLVEEMKDCWSLYHAKILHRPAYYGVKILVLVITFSWVAKIKRLLTLKSVWK